MTARYNIPGIELGEELGRGAFGKVYQGRHVTLDVPVAVKILEGLSRITDVHKAVREGRIMARLDHPNIVRIHDSGLIENAVYHVVEFMDGGSLGGAHHMPPVVLEDVARQLLSAVQCLHHAKIVHRDIKPANCLRRTADGRIKLADMGIAVTASTLATSQANLAGTLGFMAPELFSHEGRASFVTDLYALGMTLCALALDQNPFPQGTFGQLMDWCARGQRPSVAATRADLPVALSTLIDKLIAPKPSDRPQSAEEALAQLDALRVPPPARTSGVSVLSAPPDERRLGPWMIGDVLREGGNWRSFAVMHRDTGLAARLVHLQPNGTLRGASDAVLEAAARGAEIEHAGVLEVHDYGRWDGRAYVVTGPSGRTLDEVIRSSGPVSEREALTIGAALADALAYIHARGWVFQIVEPGAVSLDAEGRLAQLGWPLYCVPAGTIASSGGQSRRIVVPAHAAPEVFREAPTIEPAVDLYGLGEVMFFLLVGKRAHLGETVGELAVTKLGPVPDVRALAPECTAPTAAWVTRLLDPDPVRRPQAVEVREALRRIARKLSPEGRATAAVRDSGRPER